jgi:hypothetical protein
MSTPQLSPPWYTLWNEIKSTIGNDPGLSVSKLDTSKKPYLVKITITDFNQAQATASIMKLNYDMGDVAVEVAILDQNGQPVSPVIPQSAEQLSEFVQTAFTHNGWYVGVNMRPIQMGGPMVVFPIFSKAVIQFPNDDIGDWYFNFNEVAARAFGQVLEGMPGGIGLYPSTDNK